MIILLLISQQNSRDIQEITVIYNCIMQLLKKGISLYVCKLKNECQFFIFMSTLYNLILILLLVMRKTQNSIQDSKNMERKIYNNI